MQVCDRFLGQGKQVCCIRYKIYFFQLFQIIFHFFSYWIPAFSKTKTLFSNLINITGNIAKILRPWPLFILLSVTEFIPLNKKITPWKNTWPNKYISELNHEWILWKKWFNQRKTGEVTATGLKMLKIPFKIFEQECYCETITT